MSIIIVTKYSYLISNLANYYLNFEFLNTALNGIIGRYRVHKSYENKGREIKYPQSEYQLLCD